ncbi:MAG: hypothetical protein ACKVT1_13525 [Dehalococcoidia bacterium]
MITGRFEQGTGLPMVTAHIWLVESGSRIDVDCLLDITIPRSSLSTSRLAGNQSLTPASTEIRAVLSLEHQDGGRSGFFLDLHTTDADYSRLGRDVLERTVVVYDPRGGNLLVEVLDADL